VGDWGIRVFAMAAAALGAIGLYWDDFALVWQPVPPGVPGRALLAYVAGALFLIGGVMLLPRRTAPYGALLLTALYAVNVLLHVPDAGAHPGEVVSWSGIAEQLALVVGGAVTCAFSAPLDAATSQRLIRIARIVFGMCLLAFGAAHFAYPAPTAAMVPKYLPPNQIFWAYATGAGHVAAGLAILSGVLARAAAWLLFAMFASFALLVHLPILVADPTTHLNWTMNAVNLALTGTALLIAESYRARA